MKSTSLLPLLPGPLWSGVVAPERILPMGKIDQTVSKQMTDVKFWLLYRNTWNHLALSKKKKKNRDPACFRMLSAKYVYK